MKNERFDRVLLLVYGSVLILVSYAWLASRIS